MGAQSVDIVVVELLKKLPAKFCGELSHYQSSAVESGIK